MFKSKLSRLWVPVSTVPRVIFERGSSHQSSVNGQVCSHVLHCRRQAPARREFIRRTYQL